MIVIVIVIVIVAVIVAVAGPVIVAVHVHGNATVGVIERVHGSIPPHRSSGTDALLHPGRNFGDG